MVSLTFFEQCSAVSEISNESSIFATEIKPAERRVAKTGFINFVKSRGAHAQGIYQQVYLPELLERVSAGKILEAPATYRSASISKSSHL